MANQDPDKEDILRAKQAVSPAGLGDRSDKATRMPGNERPEDSPIDGLETDPENDVDDQDVSTTHPNRNRDGKPNLDKPAYGGT
ncbi:hypothetical protein ACFSUS_01305 [Spirosoma soli]|uniref:Uncharacterized protein n=1 Tax=Spirosoma soli TaxID=1770529 RepID=A0ABW5LYZ2_9BACT